MLFNSLEFILVFLPLTLVAFFLVSRYLRPRFGSEVLFFVLSAASLLFYSYWYWPNIFVLLSSILVNFTLGQWITRSDDQKQRKIWCCVGVALNLAVIGYFKYFNFFSENITGLFGHDHTALKIMMPLGISFFTFQQIAYLVDCYRDNVKARSLLEYTFFVSFFPQLIAGPIVLYKTLREQYSDPSFGTFKINYFVVGVVLFTMGLGKKILIADHLSLISQPVFTRADLGETLQFFEAWAGILAYTYQLYFDFSGYSDMAIGLALLIGLKLPINFDSPYKATSIIEFWRRWHITFSNFLRDYLYIPLGGSKQGAQRTAINLLLVMFLGGLWHGAAWTFVFWGCLHGAFLVVNHTYRRIKKGEGGVFSFAPIAYLTTMMSVALSWVFFRAESFQGAWNIISTMFGKNKILMPSEIHSRLPEATHSFLLLESEKDLLFWTGSLTWDAFPFIVIIAFCALLLPSTTDIYRKFMSDEQGGVKTLNPAFGLFLGVIFTLCILLLYANSASEFLYFQF